VTNARPLLVLSVLIALLLAGCGGTTTSATGPAHNGPFTITVTPNDGTKNVAADQKVTVTATGGSLSEVRVTDADGHELVGALDPARTTWTASAPVRVSARYAVHAWGAGGDGHQVEQEAAFSTKDEHRSSTLEATTILPKNGATVGVAQPLVVAFDQPVANRKQVQRALAVTTTPHVVGAWYWIDSQTVDYRPQQFWPTGTKVTLNVRIAHIKAGTGVLGGQNRTSSFTVGRNQVVQVDTKTHKFAVLRDGVQVKSFDVSTGKPGWETRNGTEVMQERVGKKHWTNEEIDAPEHYSLHSAYAIRITDSGEFVHDAPWATGSIGDANTSHGCVGLKTKDAKWIWENSMLGDPVVITGSDKNGQELYNRFDDWNISWSTWLKGNVDSET
jgi:lipoprotein-anchoring transpeptidase ErfK/SrfK